MGLMDKFKNLFTEEVEEEVKPIKKDVRRVEIPSPKRETKKEESTAENVSDSAIIHKEEKPAFQLYFDDKDFDDLEKPKKEEKPVKETPKIEAYQGAKTQRSEHKFEASPIISPVYGILDKNYKKEDISTRKEQPTDYIRKPRVVTVDDIRNKAFGTLEDDLEDTLFGDKSILLQEDETLEPATEGIDIFDDLEQVEQEETKLEQPDDMIEFKEEELPEEPAMEDIASKETIAVSSVDEDMDEDTILLAKQLEEQKRKLEEINEYINENSTENETIENEMDFPEETNEPETAEDLIDFPDEKEQDIEEPTEESTEESAEDLTESELLNLVDAMYEKREDE